VGLAATVRYDWRQERNFTSPKPRPQLEHWYEDRIQRIKEFRASLFLVHSKDRTTERFNSYVSEWRKDTLALSSIPEKVNHPSYLKVIALGPTIVPSILKELRDRPTHWFAALEALTEDGPLGSFARFDDRRAAWLEWGMQRGFIERLHNGSVPSLPKARKGKPQAKKSF
jgi:hypothetical protein